MAVVQKAAVLLIPANGTGFFRDGGSPPDQVRPVQQLASFNDKPHAFYGMAGIGMLAQHIRQFFIVPADNLMDNILA